VKELIGFRQFKSNTIEGKEKSNPDSLIVENAEELLPCKLALLSERTFIIKSILLSEQSE
jgi:hypothetical protein